MSDEILRELIEIKGIIKTHISTTRLEIDQLSKTVNIHSEVIWGKNGNPGLSLQMDRQIEIQKQTVENQKTSKTWKIIIATPVIGLLVERFYSIFIHTDKLQ